MKAVQQSLHQVGQEFNEHVQTLKYITLLFRETVPWFFRRPWRWEEIFHSVVQMGIGSLPVVLISTAFAGMVVTNELAWHMNEALSSISMIPGVSGQFIVRELGIAVPAMILVAKVGASTTAEIGTMKVTEQIDALKLLGINPVGYLVFPRLIAAVISITALTLIAIAFTLVFAIFVAVAKFNFGMFEFINALRPFVGLGDLACALCKGISFGILIPMIACGYAFRCQGGAKGVGSTTTNAVVTTTVSVILVDFIWTYVFSLLL